MAHYELTDEDVEVWKEAIGPMLIAMTFTGGPDVERIAHAAQALNDPLKCDDRFIEEDHI